MGETPPIDEDSQQQAQPQARGNAVVDVAALACPYARMKRDWTFKDANPMGESGVQKIGIEFQVDARVEFGQKIAQCAVAAQLVGGSHIRERNGAKMLQLQNLARKEISVMHVQLQLRITILQLFDDPAAVDHIRVGDVG